MNKRTRVIVAGSRGFDDFNLLVKELVNCFESKGLLPEDIEIVSGTANGADKLGERFAEMIQDVMLTRMPADWDKLGKRAGYIRNYEMAMYAKENPNPMCFLFWDGASKGTEHMKNISVKAEIELHVVKYLEEVES